MKIVLIGAGNVATHLGIALQKAGYTAVQRNLLLHWLPDFQ